MTFIPVPTITTGVGEPRVWSIDTDANEALGMLIDVLERIQQQLGQINNNNDLKPGERF